MTTSYYGNFNPELLRWTPLAARDVLELGCGEGALAAAYKRRNPAARYTAIEAHAPSAALARARVDRLVEADIQAMDAEAFAALGSFDAVVMGDVLEHLADPWAVLRQLHDVLREDGALVLSVPNAGHWSVAAELLNGRWPAHDSGLFDRTHLRWFTLDSLRRILADAGFATLRARPRQFLLNEAAAAAAIPALADAAVRLGADRAAYETQARTLQWVTSARRAEAPAPERLHVHFAAITPDFLDSRMRLPAEALASDPSIDVSYGEKQVSPPRLPVEQPKVMVVQRLALPDAAAVERFMRDVEARGWAVAYEIDDHPGLIGRVQRSNVGELLDLAVRGFHAVQTSTERLARELAPRAGPVAVFRNAVLELPPPAPRDRLRLFHGALNREGFTGEVAARLGEVAARHPEAEWVVVHDRAFFERLPAERKVFLRAQSHADYLAQMARCEVVLSPLQGAESEMFKSDIKFLEAAACGAAMVASPAVYADTIEDGVTGLIAPGLDDWAPALDRLLGDADFRRRVAEAAHAYVARERMMCAQVGPRVAWYRSLWRDRERLAREGAGRRVAVSA
ncbi:MAG: methyltransferase domain-containing protein [Caulobacteraceae bacterium]|nr:methyltransferase domain-containing protein [Caulobacter sp.]